MTTLDVLGEPVEPGRKVLFHEHLQFGWPGFDLDYKSRRTEEDRALKVLNELSSEGYGALVDATTIECGRDLQLLQRLAERTSIQIIASTGIYHAAKGFPDHLASLSVEELADLFLHDLSGQAGGAGVIKVAAERLPFAKRETKAMTAAGRISSEFDVSVVAHTVHAEVAQQMLDVFEAGGGRPERIVLGHLDGELHNIELIDALARRRPFIGIDRFGAGGESADLERVELICAFRDRGLLDAVLISHDRPLTFLGRVETDFGPDNLFLHIERKVLPQLRQRGFSEAELRTLLVENPSRFLQSG